MPVAEARVPTGRASRYLVQLCRHADRMRGMRHRSTAGPAPAVDDVESSGTVGAVRFTDGRLTLRATAEALILRVEAVDDEALRRLQDGVAARLEKIGRRDGLTTTWHRLDRRADVPADRVDVTGQSIPPDSGRRRWRGRLTVLGLAAGAALIVAVHLGLGGAALAATSWTGRVGGILMMAILGFFVLVAAHIILGRFAFRRGKAIRARWMSRHSPRLRTPGTEEHE
jgi:hypothetical protein